MSETFFGWNWHQKYLDDETYARPTAEDIMCETQFNALSVHEMLYPRVNEKHFFDQLDAYKDKWVPYLPKADQNNNREGLLLWGLEGDSCNDSLSLPEARQRSGRPELMESECNYPTQFYKDMECLHPVCDYFAPLGRSFIVKANAGAYFPAHKDYPLISRDCFRIVCFFGDVERFHWQTDNIKLNIEAGRWYYIDTRKIHRTNSWSTDSSYHVILNIPKTWKNTLKLLSIAQK